MGRFTLRDEGMTIGSGKVLKYKPAKIIQELKGTTSFQPTSQQSEEKKQNQIQ